MDYFSSANILIVGDVMLDRYWGGSSNRLSPEAPVPIVEVTDTDERVGGAGNVALNIASLCGHSTIVSLIGNDTDAVSVKRILLNGNVNSFLEETNSPTITKLRVISQQQQLLRLDFEKGFHTHNKNSMTNKVITLLGSHDVLVLSDYGKGTLSNLEELICAAKEKKIPVLVDPKGSDFRKYSGATIITPNMKEFEGVVGKCGSDDDIKEKAMKLIKELSLGALLITRSEKGMMLITNAGSTHTVPTVAKEVYDVTGAGDTVIAVMAIAYALNYSNPEAMRLANAAAGLVVAKVGTATITKTELYHAMNTTSLVQYGVITKENLVQEVQKSRFQGEKIVMTNGCFDIIHAGHIAYLKEAKKRGDKLVVAINTDESISRIKGEARPIVKLKHRMEVLSALECVDWVVPFSDDTPIEIIKAILPNVLIKGADYEVDQIVGANVVLGNGGVVETIDLVPECSTSSIIRKVLNNNL